MTTVLLSDTYPREIKTHVHIKNVYTSVDSNIIHDRPNWKQPKCPSTDKWINTIWYIYMSEYHLAIKMKC